ncbi:MAG TPA: hypothetical protein VGQ59_12515, partial [Cyclobacteriaceae bacterium]|nr:hypothetical protein [Cyclobacteriaceae bacterium]
MNTTLILGLTLMAIIAITGILIYIRRIKSNVPLTEVQKSKQQQGQIILYSSLAILVLFLVVGTVVTVMSSNNFLKNLSATIIICWLVILVAYYAWAIYFYNINLGWSDDKWDRHRIKQEIDPSGSGPTPNENPNSEETMGLPPGTVRGTLALTLLVTAIALVVGSLGEESVIKTNSVLADHFEFVKNAFLMMIAFYFGTKGLDALKSDSAQPLNPNPPAPTPPPPTVDTKMTDDE